MNPFQTSDHGLLKAGIAPVFDRLENETAVGNWFCVVDKSENSDSTFGTGCETYAGDAPLNGDPIGVGGTFGQFTKIVVVGVVYAYKLP